MNRESQTVNEIKAGRFFREVNINAHPNETVLLARQASMHDVATALIC